MTIYTMMDAMTLESYRVIMLNPDVLTALLVVTIACFAGAYALIRFRRTERVGNPYVYSVGKYIMPSAVVFAIVSLFMVATLPEGGEFEFIDRSELVGPYMAMLIITFVVYVIMELISGKGFGKFYNTMLRYVVTMAVSVVVCLAIYAANGMGLANLVPDVDKVNTAVFTVSGDYGSDDFSLNRVTVDSPEMIEKVAEIHRSIPKYDHAKDDPYRFEVMYTLDSGSVIEREYFITSDEYAAAMQQLLTPEVFYTSQTINRVWNTERYTVTVESISSENGMDVINMPIEKLLDALYEDSRLVSYDLISDPEKTCAEYYLKVNRVDNVGQSGDNYWSYAGTYMESIQIWPWQQNTIKLLESYGANNALQTGNSVYILRVPAESIYSYKDNEMFAEKLYLNVYREDRLDGTQEYSGDFSYSVKGSSEMLPGGLYCMADAKTQHLDLIYAANRDEIEDLYHYDQIYMMIYADMSKADKEGTFCIDLNDSVKFVGMDEYNTAEWIFEYLYY